MKFFERFAEKHPKAARWIREGGLFLIFSYVITFLKYLMLLFLPKLFSAYAGNGFGWAAGNRRQPVRNTVYI